MCPERVSTWSKLFQAGKYTLPVSLMLAEVAKAVKAEGRNHRPGASQSIVRGVKVKLSVPTCAKTTLWC